MDPRTTRTRGRLDRKRINVPALLASEGFTWKGSGPWVELGCCPFCKDARDTFRANLETGRLRCMCCNWTGDPVAYAMHRHGLGFRQAAERLGAWEELPENGIHPFRGGAR
jgi:hypothetical protein